MEQQGTSTPGGAGAADPSAVRANDPNPQEQTGEPGRCCFGNPEHPGREQATIPARPANDPVVSEEAQNQEKTAPQSRAESGTP